MATRRTAASPGSRAVLYVRVSTARQASDGLSLEAQHERLAAYCTLRGLQVVEVVVEPGESAAKPMAARPGGRKVLTLVKRGAVNAVVVLKLDRAFRNTIDALQTIDAWDRAGVGFHVADMGGSSIDTSGAMGRMMLTMLAGFAEFERNLTAERTTAALAHKARTGRMRLGKDAPFGWRYQGEGLVQLPEEQAAIMRAKVLRATGMSLAGIASELRTHGHRNRAGNPFAPSQVDRMLRGSVRQANAGETSS